MFSVALLQKGPSLFPCDYLWALVMELDKILTGLRALRYANFNAISHITHNDNDSIY